MNILKNKKANAFAGTFAFFTTHKSNAKKIKRASKQTLQDIDTMDRHNTTEEKQRTANSTYKKLAVQWLNEALCFPA